MLNIQMLEDKPSAVIKVFSVGGCGCNAVAYMIKQGIRYQIEFIAANTDLQTLNLNPAPVLLQLGKTLTKGLGAGCQPEKGKQAAQESREQIKEALQGADLVFITAGMGGGTGTGGAPIVAEVAKEMNILTVGVVTRPCKVDGKRIAGLAEDGITALSAVVDSLMVLPNDKMLEELGGDVDLEEAYMAGNQVLYGAVAGIAEIISTSGLVNVDFADVCTIMGEKGRAMMCSAESSGVDRARIAAEKAIASPFLEDVHLTQAAGILVNLTATKITVAERQEIMAIMDSYAKEGAIVKYGIVKDEAMGDRLRVTIVATGLSVISNDVPMAVVSPVDNSYQQTGTDHGHAAHLANVPSYADYDAPAAFRNRRQGVRQGVASASPVGNHTSENVERPAFLRRQSD